MDKFPIVTSIPPNSIHAEFVRAWEKAGFAVYSVNSPEEARALHGADVKVIESKDSNRKQLISTLVSAACGLRAPCAAIVNADCLPIDELTADIMLDLTRGRSIIAQRVDVDEALSPIDAFSFGFDGMFFDCSTIPAALKSDADWRIGEQFWDYWFPLKLRQHSVDVYRAWPPILLHIQHPVRYSKQENARQVRKFRQCFADLFADCIDGDELRLQSYATLFSLGTIDVPSISPERERYLGETAKRASTGLISKNHRWRSRPRALRKLAAVKRLIKEPFK